MELVIKLNDGRTSYSSSLELPKKHKTDAQSTKINVSSLNTSWKSPLKEWRGQPGAPRGPRV